MKKVLAELNLDPWDYEIQLRIDGGMEAWTAKSLVVRRWMQAGDLRPLLSTIKGDGMLRGPILSLLAQMIEGDQIGFVRKGAGRPNDPSADVRNEFAADTYEDFLQHALVGSDDLFRAVAAVCGVSVETVRQAVTERRTNKAKE
jgi:hypothetical protein